MTPADPADPMDPVDPVDPVAKSAASAKRVRRVPRPRRGRATDGRHVEPLTHTDRSPDGAGGRFMSGPRTGSCQRRRQDRASGLSPWSGSAGVAVLRAFPGRVGTSRDVRRSALSRAPAAPDSGPAPNVPVRAIRLRLGTDPAGLPVLALQDRVVRRGAGPIACGGAKGRADEAPDRATECEPGRSACEGPAGGVGRPVVLGRSLLRPARGIVFSGMVVLEPVTIVQSRPPSFRG